MKQLIIILALLLSVSVPVSAAWDKSDTALLALRIIDWGQTMDIATNYYNNPIYDALNGGALIGYERVYRYEEINPILGDHPSSGKVNNYFASLIIFDQLVRTKAENSEKWAKFEKYWKNINIGIESSLTIRNYNLGVEFKF